MTAYWDDKSRAVSAASREHRDRAEFCAAIAEIEQGVIRTVSLVTGDRDFPDDLRERIQSVIATKRIINVDGSLNAEPESYAACVRSSEMIEDLHSVFHNVAGRRPPHRFDGWFSDDPSGFLRIREAALGGVT